MLHPSYHDLMNTVNSGVEQGETPIVNSRYSIVLATAKRARQLIDGVEPLTEDCCPKPLSIAIEELADQKIHILSDEEVAAANERRRQREEELSEQEELIFFEEEG